MRGWTARSGRRFAGVAAVALAGLAGAAGCAGRSAGAESDAAAAPATYQVYVANESSDVVSRVAFRPDRGAWVANTVEVGVMPADLDGPHGLKVSPDGRYWYLSLAHGTPYGKVWKFVAGPDTLAGRTEAGRFPATMSLTPDGQYLFAANFNLHGDPVPSSVSVIHTPTMTEVAQPTTCVMPHGSRMNAAGTRQYSVCMHSQQLVELDARSFEVVRRLSVAPGREGALAADNTDGPGRSGDAVCAPTWATPGTGARADRFVYVPCNKGGEVLEVDVERWRISRRFPTGKAPYNLDVTPDGRLLLATLKGEQALAVIDLDTGEELARVPMTQPVTHGVVVSPDGRYAFVSNEAVGGTPGTVDVVDLASLERVASVAVEYQPGGIDFWRMSR